MNQSSQINVNNIPPPSVLIRSTATTTILNTPPKPKPKPKSKPKSNKQ